MKKREKQVRKRAMELRKPLIERLDMTIGLFRGNTILNVSTTSKLLFFALAMLVVAAVYVFYYNVQHKVVLLAGWAIAAVVCFLYHKLTYFVVIHIISNEDDGR